MVAALTPNGVHTAPPAFAVSTAFVAKLATTPPKLFAPYCRPPDKPPNANPWVYEVAISLPLKISPYAAACTILPKLRFIFPRLAPLRAIFTNSVPTAEVGTALVA